MWHRKPSSGNKTYLSKHLSREICVRDVLSHCDLVSVQTALRYFKSLKYFGPLISWLQNITRAHDKSLIEKWCGFQHLNIQYHIDFYFDQWRLSVRHTFDVSTHLQTNDSSDWPQTWWIKHEFSSEFQSFSGL